MYDSLTIPTSNYSNELFIRVRVRLDSDHDTSFGSAKKLLRMFYWDGNSATYKDSFEVVYGGAFGYQCNSGNGGDCNAYWGDASGDNTGTPGSWHKVEQYFNSATGQVKIWHDGVLVKDQMVGKTGNKWTPFYLTSNWSDAHDASNHVYFDEVEVYSDNGTGASGSLSNATVSGGGSSASNGGSSPVPPPSAPGGLSATVSGQ